MIDTKHNNPPTDFELLEQRAADAYGEAKLWIDGDDITTEGQAAGVGRLVGMLRSVSKEADTMHKTEKAPHLAAGRAVDERFRDMRTTTQRALDCCLRAIGIWQKKLADEQRREGQRLQEEAEQKKSEAAQAIQKSRGNVEAREAAEQELKNAEQAEAAAKAAARAKPNVATGYGGKALGLRTYYRADLTSIMVAVTHYMNHPAMADLVMKLAAADVRSGAREVPGFTIVKEERAA